MEATKGGETLTSRLQDQLRSSWASGASAEKGRGPPLLRRNLLCFCLGGERGEGGGRGGGVGWVLGGLGDLAHAPNPRDLPEEIWVQGLGLKAGDLGLGFRV